MVRLLRIALISAGAAQLVVAECPDDCSSPTCIDGIDANGGIALTGTVCAGRCSPAYGGDRFCGTVGHTDYEAEGSVDCSTCVAQTTVATVATTTAAASLTVDAGAPTGLLASTTVAAGAFVTSSFGAATSFVMTGGATTTPQVTSDETETATMNGTPTWAWVLIGLFALIIGAGLVFIFFHHKASMETKTTRGIHNHPANRDPGSPMSDGGGSMFSSQYGMSPTGSQFFDQDGGSPLSQSRPDAFSSAYMQAPLPTHSQPIAMAHPNDAGLFPPNANGMQPGYGDYPDQPNNYNQPSHHSGLPNHQSFARGITPGMTQQATGVPITSITHPTQGATGKYFFFSSSDWMRVFGSAPSGSVDVQQWRNGVQIWSGNVMVVWDNANGDAANGVVGRRDPDAAAGQWNINDVVQPSWGGQQQMPGTTPAFGNQGNPYDQQNAYGQGQGNTLY